MKKIVLTAAAALAALALTAGAALADAPKDYEESGATQAIGGILNTSDGRLSYVVPDDAYWFSDQTRIRYFKPGISNLAPLPENAVTVGDPFRLELREWPALTMLSWRKPATITIHYKPEELGGRSESWLRIVRYFDSWVQLPSTIDTVNHTVTTQVPWGGDYALLAYNSEPPAPPAPAGSDNQAAPAPAPAPTGSSISGRIYYDKNGNGVFDGDDTPVGGAAIRIGNDSFNAMTSTGPDGIYTFSNLGAGTYTLDLVVGGEWDFTTPNEVAGIALTGQPDSKATANFGMTYKSWYKPW